MNKSHLKFARLLLHLEGHRCTFRQIVEPAIAYIAASKRVGLPVLSKERSGAPVAPELCNRASHTLWLTSGGNVRVASVANVRDELGEALRRRRPRRCLRPSGRKAVRGTVFRV